MKFNWKRIGLSFGIALGMLLASYLVSNIPYPFFDTWGPFAFIRTLAGDRFQTDWSEESLFCVNVAIDQQLADVVTPEGDVIGHASVTDRNQLLHLLDVAKKSDYRYFFMDIRFPSGLVTDVDSVLFSKIKEMPNFVLAHHISAEGYTIADSTLLSKAAISDYKFTPFTGFTRYQFLQKGGKSIALKMYEDLDGGNVVRRGPFYKSGRKLCRNAQFIMIPKAVCEKEREDYIIRYPYLGAHLFDWNTDEELARMMKDKIIIVGDFDEDIHQTYVGDVPGPMLSYLAYNELHDGRHQIKGCLWIVLLLLYTCFVWISLGAFAPWYKRVPLIKNINSHFWCFVLSLIGWGAVFWLLEVLLFISFKIALSSFIPSLCLALLSDYQSTYNSETKQ